MLWFSLSSEASAPRLRTAVGGHRLRADACLLGSSKASRANRMEKAENRSGRFDCHSWKKTIALVDADFGEETAQTLRSRSVERSRFAAEKHKSLRGVNWGITLRRRCDDPTSPAHAGRAPAAKLLRWKRSIVSPTRRPIPQYAHRPPVSSLAEHIRQYQLFLIQQKTFARHRSNLLDQSISF